MSVFSLRTGLGLATAACSVLSFSGSAFAQLNPNPEFVVNQVTAGLQLSIGSSGDDNRIVELSNGNRAVIYQDASGNDGGQGGAFVSLIDENDTVLGTVNVSNSTASDTFGGIAALSTGGFVATFYRFSGNYDCYARVFDNAGTETVAEFLVHAPNANHELGCDVAALAGGDFYVVWRNTASDNMFGQRFNSDGSPDGVVDTIESGGGESIYPTVNALASGGYVTTWVDNSGTDGDSRGVYMRAYDASGAETTTGAVRVNTTTAGSQDLGTAAGLSNGNIAFAWVDWGDTSVAARILSPTGAEIVPEFEIFDGGSNNFAMAALPAGGFLVALPDYTIPPVDGSNEAIGLYQFDNSGTETANLPVVNTTTNGIQRFPSIGTFADGSFMVAYTDQSNAVDGDSWTVLARSFTGFTLDANTRVIDAFVTASSDIGASGTDLIASDLDFAELDVDVELEFAVVVQNTDQFDLYSGDNAELTVDLEGMVFAENITSAVFSSGGTCSFVISDGGLMGGAFATFSTSDLSACDDEVVDRDYSNGGDDDMVFTVPVRLTSGDVNFSVEISRNGDTVLGSDTHDSNDANDEADPVSEGGDVSSVLTYGNAAVSATNPLGEGAFVNATLASDYNQLDCDCLGTLDGLFDGKVYAGGSLVDFDETAHIDTVTLTVNIADAHGLEAIGLDDSSDTVEQDITLEADNSASVSFTLDNTGDVTLSDLVGGLAIYANADTDDDTQIQRTAVTTQIDVAYVDALELTDESNPGGIDQIGREGATGEFEWVGDTTAATQNVWRLTGLGDTAPALYVTLENSTLDVDGQYGLTPANAISNGELILTQTDIQNAVGQAFGRADVTLEVEASGVTMRRFMVTNGVVTEYTADYSLGANQIGD